MNLKEKYYWINLAHLSNAHTISLDPQLSMPNQSTSHQLYNFLPSTFVDNPRKIHIFFHQIRKFHTFAKMLTAETPRLFTLAILFDNNPLTQYPPTPSILQDLPSSRASPLDKLSLIQANPNTEFSLLVTYIGTIPLSKDNAYAAEISLDGVSLKGKVFYEGGHNVQMITGKRISGIMEQPYDI
jgi:hypothetical protein